MCHIVQCHIDQGGTDSLREFQAVAFEATSIDKAGNRYVAVQDKVVVGGLAVIADAVEHGGGHLGVAQRGGPSAEDRLGCNVNRAAHEEKADQVERQLVDELCDGQMPNRLSKRHTEVGRCFRLRADMGIHNPQNVRWINHQRFARLLLHLCRHLRGHQRRHPGGPGHPYIAFLPRRAEHQAALAKRISHHRHINVWRGHRKGGVD